MSRIGKKPISIPSGVTVDLREDAIVVTGPKGTISRLQNPFVHIEKNADGLLSLSVEKELEKKERSLWGTYAAHIRNMIEGVTVGFKKQLEIQGVGYRVAMQGKDIKLEVGFSHPVIFPTPQGITASVEKNIITIEGADIEQVGKTTAEIRSIKKPEPYKGKGIRYVGEEVRRKAGKAAKSA